MYVDISHQCSLIYVLYSLAYIVQLGTELNLFYLLHTYFYKKPDYFQLGFLGFFI